MLFHTWTFLIFMAVVLPVLFGLRRTRLWIPWLLIASYTFYGWWNPYYLILVFYSTLLDFVLVALMDHCPIERSPSPPSGERVGVRGRRRDFNWRQRLTRVDFTDPVMKVALRVTALR